MTGSDDATPRGFTGHEMLDDLGLVHMNGRIYDALLGRFLSADIVVQNPADLQAFNRYSYVLNRPLTLVEPTGYFWAELWAGFVEGFKQNANAQAAAAGEQVKALGHQNDEVGKLVEQRAAEADNALAETTQRHTDSGIAEDDSVRAAGCFLGKNAGPIVDLLTAYRAEQPPDRCRGWVVPPPRKPEARARNGAETGRRYGRTTSSTLCDFVKCRRAKSRRSSMVTASIRAS